MNYKITIAIPTYRREILLLESVKSALDQINYCNYEVLIVDNDNENLYNIKEKVMKIGKKYNNKNIKYYRNDKNLGMTGNWNKCIELASGEYITILNDDDVLYTDYLEKITKLIQGDKAIFFGIDVEKNGILQNKKIKNGISKKRISLFDLFLGYPIASTLGILYRKDILLRIGGVKEKYYPTIDSNLLLDYILESGAIYYRKKLSGKYRIANTNTSNKTAKDLPICDFYLRKRIISQMKILKNFFEYFSYYLYKTQKEYIEKEWNIKIEKNEYDIKINRFYFIIFCKLKSIYLKYFR